MDAHNCTKPQTGPLEFTHGPPGVPEPHFGQPSAAGCRFHPLLQPSCSGVSSTVCLLAQLGGEQTFVEVQNEIVHKRERMLRSRTRLDRTRRATRTNTSGKRTHLNPPKKRFNPRFFQLQLTTCLYRMHWLFFSTLSLLVSTFSFACH